MGAKEAFLGGMLAAICANLPLDQSLCFGNLVSAAVASTHEVVPRHFGRQLLQEIAGSTTRSLNSAIWDLLAGSSLSQGPATDDIPDTVMDEPDLSTLNSE